MSFRATTAFTVFAAASLWIFGGGIASTNGNAAAFARDEPGLATPTPPSEFPQPVGWPKILSSSVNAERVGPGVRYERWALFTDAGPLLVSVAAIDLKNPSVALAVATHDDVIIGKGERLSSMADRLGAELGINADYFDINETGSPLNIVAADQRVLHQPDRAAAFVVDRRGGVFMGAVAWQTRLATASGASQDISLVNDWSPSTDVALLTSQLGVKEAAGATEVVLAPTATPEQYRVKSVDANLSLLDSLAADELAVAAHGAAAHSLADAFHPGDIVTMTAVTDPALAEMKLAIGGGPLLVKDGTMVADPAAPAPEETDVRNPVTGAGLSADGNTLWLVVVDGRQPAISIGLTRPQLASLFIALGAQTAMAFDSGGSSEMVVRHAGDLTSSVGNTPSDLRERSIADGLFVLNMAPRGVVAQMMLKARAAAVLVGSSLAIQVRAIDRNAQPLVVLAHDVSLSADPSAVASIDRDGSLRALRPGTARVSASMNGVAASAAVRIVPSVDALAIEPSNPTIVAGGTLHLFADARTNDGKPVAVDASSVRWSVQGGAGRVAADGTFAASATPSKTVVTAQAGGATATAIVLSGDHAVVLQATPQAGTSNAQWHYTAKPSDIPGGVDASSAPDGSAALRLAYDFSGQQAMRAAYAETSVLIPGEPIALGVDVFGDGNNEWLRGGYRNADGNNESLTIARHVDWRGWKTIRAAIPAQASWPLTWTRLYVVERSKDAREQGSLWFRNLRLFFPGP